MIAARLEAPPVVARIANPRPPVARSRSGRVLHQDLRDVLLPGERLQPATRRVLRVLMGDEGRLFTFDELARLAAIGMRRNDRLARADRLHWHVYHIRRALIDESWVDSIAGIGVVFLRRQRHAG